MLFVSLLGWWFGEGLFGQVKRVEQRLSATADYFSIALLLKTLFSPFRQISAGKVDGPLAVRWHAWLDKLVSRGVGAVFRTLTIFAGVITLSLQLVLGMLLLLGWLLLPVLPIIGLVLSVSGWLPWSR